MHCAITFEIVSPCRETGPFAFRNPSIKDDKSLSYLYRFTPLMFFFSLAINISNQENYHLLVILVNIRSGILSPILVWFNRNFYIYLT